MNDADDTLDTTGIDDDMAGMILATHSGDMTSADLREAYTIAVASGWRPRFLRCGTPMTPAQREAKTLPPGVVQRPCGYYHSSGSECEVCLQSGSGYLAIAERRTLLREERHGAEMACDVDWEDGE